VNWEEHLKAAASSSPLLLAVLSPNYLSSPCCSNERRWFSTQPHVGNTCPFAVAGWLPVGQNPVPKEFGKAERHPPGGSWLGLLSPDERISSAREFALKLRDSLVKMRASASAVFLGAASGPGVATRSRLRDELEKSGYRVVPEPDYVYEDTEEVRAYLKAALLAIHFPGDGLGLEGLTAMEESFSSAGKTLLITPFGSKLTDDESEIMKRLRSNWEARATSPASRTRGSRARLTTRFGTRSSVRSGRRGSRRRGASSRWGLPANGAIWRERRRWLA
jgi:hypothetical protein